MDNRRYEESKADFKVNHRTPSLSFPVKILQHAATMYTPPVLKMLQNELCKAHDCTMTLLEEIGTMAKYEIAPHGKDFKHMVTYNSTNSFILCSCKKFEFAGILCAHALKVLSIKKVLSIPPQYILRRWTKNVKAKSAKIDCPKINNNDPKIETARRYKELC